MKIEKIIEKLARSDDLKCFEDIRILEDKEEYRDTIAFTDIKNKTLYLNPHQKFIDTETMLANLEGLIIHEAGHLDKRLKVPATLEKAQHDKEQIEKKTKGFDHNLLNILYDLEIHFQYNILRKLRYSKRLKLREFLTCVRNRLFELNREDMLLSLEYQFTELQKEVNKIIRDRSLNIVEKYLKIKDLLDKQKQEQGEGEQSKQQGGKAYTEVIIDDSDQESEQGQDSKQQKVNAKKLRESSKSIKDEIEKKAKELKAREKLSSLGFSDEEIDILCSQYDVDELIMMIENLEKSLDSVLPDLNTKNGETKTREYIRSRGYRFNGYRKMRDYDEIIENPEDLVTVGKFDLEEIRIPVRIRRKTKSIIVILRDVSGSVSSEPLARIIRDVTVTLIKIAQRRQYKVAVIDFHSTVEPIRDKNNEVITDDYNIILLKSMKFKSGWSTCLSKALKFIEEELVNKKLENNNVNIFIVTDSYVDDCSNVKFEKVKQVNMVGLWCKESDYISENFIQLIKNFKGKIYIIQQIQDKLVTELYQCFS